jgi:sulfate transport system permease protein
MSAIANDSLQRSAGLPLATARPHARIMGRRLHPTSVLPGFGLSLGYAVFYFSLIVLLPIVAVYARSFSEGLDAFTSAAFSERAINAYKLSFGAALFAAAINGVFGFIVAWVLVRYRFPGRRLLDAFVDLPFALPTAVAGIALTAIYAPNGWLGQYAALIDWKLAYNPVGIVIALVFIGLPFVVRTLQPVIAELGHTPEEAAASLGAGRLRTFLRVIFPALLPAWLTGFALAFARAVGEYGSVIFIAGNLPFVSEIAPLLIVIQLEQYNYVGAAAIAVVMLSASFVLLLAINILQAWATKRSGVRHER